ncbi:heterokaryon incompatibility protein-domain-containing protein [Cubamyces lactineus]|nr:heterokaryon incompatibility protein-domain-containing protein [Cubamyces lactineus]
MRARMLIPHVGWPYALALAKTCVEDCVRDHPKCQAITPYPVGHAPLPTRLIDCSNPDCLRLLETNPGMRGTYVALSYVWGEDQPHRTTEANLSLYKVRIDPATLPQTILDAIHVTRALRISLLWIDGLCIVQDSEKDMHHELARMRHVYRHAFVTIDASSAARVSEGFLQDRELHPMPDAVLPFICPPSNPAEPSAKEAQVGMIYVVPARTVYITRPEGALPGENARSRTLQRGWCLQETLLSTRLLVFTSKTLQLRCHTKTRNVGGALHHEGSREAPRLPDAVFHPDRHVTRGSGKWIDIHRRWQKIVQDYTRRELSNPSDKLVAISALAEMFTPALGPRYLAGLWHQSLSQDLLWHSCSVLSSSRPREYRGPSWSWASTNTSVYCHEYREKYPCAEVVECTVTLQNQQLLFGAVTGASLILRSSLLQCRWFLDEDTHARRLSTCFSFSSSFRQAWEVIFDEDHSLLEGREVWFVPLAIHSTYAGEWLVGLAVIRAETDIWRRAGAQGEGDVYRRVAMARCRILQESWGEDTHARIQSIRAMLSQFPMADVELV